MNVTSVSLESLVSAYRGGERRLTEREVTLLLSNGMNFLTVDEYNRLRQARRPARAIRVRDFDLGR